MIGWFFEALLRIGRAVAILVIGDSISKWVDLAFGMLDLFNFATFVVIMFQLKSILIYMDANF